MQGHLRAWSGVGGSSLLCPASPPLPRAPLSPLPMSIPVPPVASLPPSPARWHLPSVRADSTAFSEELGGVQVIFR